MAVQFEIESVIKITDHGYFVFARHLTPGQDFIVTDKSFKDITSYPEIANDYAYTFKAIKSLSFDIWLASHASQFNLHTKHKPGDAYDPGVFIDRAGYDAALSDLQKQYDKKLQY